MRVKAFFGAPVGELVKGGAHLANEVLMKRGDRVLLLRRPKGLFGANQNQWFFAHGEFLYGETLEECSKRLVKEQAGVEATDLRTVHSWIFMGSDHWSVILVSLAEIQGEPRPDSEVSEWRFFGLNDLPDMAYWKPDELRRILGPFFQ